MPYPREVMKTHWANFITLEDFKKVAQTGISHIRFSTKIKHSVLEGDVSENNSSDNET